MIALYPGAFKPPHRGHFNVVSSLLNNNYVGSTYDINDFAEKGTSVLKGKTSGKVNIDKVIVFVGGGERNGITKQEAESIWQVYQQYLPGLEIVDGQKNPMFAAKDYAKANPNDEFVAITGIRSEDDFVDLKRVTTFKNTPNVQGLAITTAGGSGIRATDFRNKILSGNLDDILDFFPEQLSREQILNILSDLKDKVVAESLSESIEGFISTYFTDEVNEALPSMPSKDRQKLNYLYDYLKNLIPSDSDIYYKQDHLVVTRGTYRSNTMNLSENNSTKKITEYMGSLIEYMLKQDLKILPLPNIKLRRDKENAENFFGKTAHYSPDTKEIVLYVEGRHIKDIMRSFSHEMIHHHQNLEGRLNSYGTTNTNEDEHLQEIEKEAYLLGNITFRNWEDSIKNN